MKRVALLVDAAADLPYPELKDRTPLQQARLPFARELAASGSCGALKRIRAEADASRALLAECCGLSDPQARELKWGPVAAAALDLPLREGRSYFLCGFVTLNSEGEQDQVHPSSVEEQRQLLADLGKAMEVSLHSLHPGRFVMELPEKVGNPSPSKLQYEHRGFMNRLPSFLREKLAVAESVLREHPVNQVRLDLGESPIGGLWCWSGGSEIPQPPVLPFSQALVSPEPLSMGMARHWGWSYLRMDSPYALDRPDAAFDVFEMIRLLEQHEEVVIWIPAPFSSRSFEGSAEKVRRLDAVDYYVTGPVKAILEETRNSRLLLLAAGVRHRGRPERGAAPFVLWGEGIPADSCKSWTELESLQGALGTPKIQTLLERFRKES